jgi:hypothetical protein
MQFLLRVAMALLLSAWPLSYAAAQHLECNPCSHGYGRVQVGASKQYVFQLTNTGKRTLHILSKRKNNNVFLFDNFPVPVTLRPGRSTQLTVNFKPLATGKTTGAITLISDALNPKLTLSVSGTGVAVQAATLGVSPSSLDFGNVVVGSRASLQLTLSASHGSVTVSSAQLNSSEFRLLGISLPQTIAAGQNVQVTVRFSPNASGTASGKLTLSSNADNSPNNVPLSGVGVPVSSHSTDLHWNPSHDPVIGYNVYRGGTKGGPYRKINSVLEASTNYTDSTVTAGATYYYVATAVDANDAESSYSNAVKVVIPSP